MTERSVDHGALLSALSDAFARGDAALGESLLMQALDAGIPWDQATSAAAHGMARRYEARDRSERVA